MISAPTLRLIGLAIVGILVAAAVAVAASQLASRQIGLASEPVSAGDELAPPAARSHHERHAEGENQGEPSARETTTTAPATEEPSSSGETPSITQPRTGSEPPATSEPINPPDDSSRSGVAGEGSGGSAGDHSDD